MPIQFHCTHCGQFLSISQKKSGSLVTCPQCVQRTQVPMVGDGSVTISADPAEPAHGLRMEQDKNWLKTSPKPAARSKSSRFALSDEESEDEEEFHIRRREIPQPGLDMTPMVDVVMLLLIFFMITASFVTQKSLETTPPDAEGEGVGRTESVADLADESIIVRVDENNQISVDDVAVSGATELKEVLAAKILNEKKREMLIEVHPAALHGTVVAVMDAGLEVDMQRIRRTSLGPGK